MTARPSAGALTASEATPPLLSVSGIAHSFGGLDVLNDVDLSARPGEVVGLIGPNGSGKTTLFNIISGFLWPKAGEIRVNGKDVSRHSVQARSRVGLLRTFQTPKVFDHMTVLENVMMGSYAATGAGFLSTMVGLPGARRELDDVRAHALATCKRFGIGQLAAEKAGGLPAGTRRVVEFARAFQAKPQLLLLDEPSSGLSESEVEELRRWIRVLAEEGIGIVLVSHDMGLMDVCDIVNVLYFGRIIAAGPMNVIREDAAVRDAYLGT